MNENLKNEMMIFNFDENEIRTIDDNGKIWFCGLDVAKALGYTKPADAVSRHCKKDWSLIRGLTDSIGRERNTKFISEGNLYRLIIHSRLSSAEKFERWVFDEVLPTIRKHGAYIAPKKMKELEENPNKMKELCNILKTEYLKNKKLKKELEEKEALIAKQEEEISDLSLAERYLNEEEMDIHLSTDASAYRFMNNEYIAEVVLTKLRKLMRDNRTLQEEIEKLKAENENLKKTSKTNTTITSTDAISIEEHIKIIKKLLQSTDNRK